MKKKIIILLTVMGFLAACKKDAPEPEVKTVEKIVEKTVTVIQKDTVYCTPKADIIQGTWYCYQTNNTISTTVHSPSETVVFTPTSVTWTGRVSQNDLSYSSDYTYIYAGTETNPYFTITVFNCDELKLVEENGFTHWLRRNP